MIDFQLKFKGTRNYLQGGDIYNAIAEALSARFGGHLVRLAFKHFARNQCQLLFQHPAETGKVMGNGTWQAASGEMQRFWLCETDRPVTESYPFDEDAITAPAQLEGEAIVGHRSNDYSVIENVIALTKRLNYSLSPDVDGKWLFGQLDLTAGLPDTWQTIRIDRMVCVGDSFSRNRILIDGTDYGEIRFIGGQP
ncbi:MULTISPECIES: hypothetical protein [unclassified Thiocapsa]|uniref:hypothetical protein n=1 Tax=unclassified Thiocapsa TaxID=2641286 RepID=UPI0035AFCAA3